MGTGDTTESPRCRSGAGTAGTTTFRFTGSNTKVSDGIRTWLPGRSNRVWTMSKTALKLPVGTPTSRGSGRIPRTSCYADRSSPPSFPRGIDTGPSSTHPVPTTQRLTPIHTGGGEVGSMLSPSQWVCMGTANPTGRYISKGLASDQPKNLRRMDACQLAESSGTRRLCASVWPLRAAS